MCESSRYRPADHGHAQFHFEEVDFFFDKHNLCMRTKRMVFMLSVAVGHEVGQHLRRS